MRLNWARSENPKIVQPTPQPTFVQKVERYFTPEPKPDLTPVEKTEENQPHKIEVNTQLVTRDAPKNLKQVKTKDNSQVAKNLVAELRHNLSPATQVDAPGESSAAYANYASAVKSIYDAAWTLPDSVANDDENVKVSVTIGSDGTTELQGNHTEVKLARGARLRVALL